MTRNMKPIWSRNLIIPAAAGFVVFLSSNAFADQYARYTGADVIRCAWPSGPESYQVNFTTMTGVAANGDLLKLHWYSFILGIIRVSTEGSVSINITTGASDYDSFGHSINANPRAGSCRDDRGLMPDLQFKPFDPAQAQAENQPAIQDAKAISAKLSAAQKSKAQASFKQAFELFQSGEFDAAVIGFKEGLAIDPANGLANYYLGECYARQDNDDLARIRYQRTVDLAPGTKEALLAQARLKKQ